MVRWVLITSILCSIACAAGCKRGAQVIATSPAPDSMSVEQGIDEVNFTFSTELDEDTAGQAASYSFTGSESGEVEFVVALAANSSGDNNRMVVLTPVASAGNGAPPGFGLVEGESVIVRVTDRARSLNGIPVQEFNLHFRITGVAGSPDDFQPLESQITVNTAAPAQNSRGAALRPAIEVSLSQAITTSTISGNSLTLRGDQSGARTLGASNFVLGSQAATVDRLTTQLASGQDSFLPGERVTLTLSDDLAVLGMGGVATAAVRPYVLEFTTRNGTLNGTIQAPQAVSPADVPRAVVGMVAADLLFYSGPELVVLDEVLGLLLMRRTGNGWSTVHSYNGFTGTPAWLGQGDLENDGKQELVVLTRSSNRAEFFEVLTEQLVPISSGSLAVSLSGAPRDAELADLDGDGFLDLALGLSSGLVVLKAQATVGIGTSGGLPTVTFSLGSYVPVSVSQSAVEALEVADLYEDGRLDLAVANHLGLGIYRNASAFEFLRVAELDSVPATSGQVLEVGDIVGSATPEILLASGPGLRYFTAQGSGDSITWTSATLALAGGVPDAVGLADLNGDTASLNDLVTYRRTSQILAVQAGAASGVLGPVLAQHTLSSNLARPRLAFVDLNGDGGRDVLVGGLTAGPAGLHLASTSGVAAPPTAAPFAFELPESVSVQLGNAEFVVTLSASLGSAISGFTTRLAFDSDDLRLVRIDAHPDAFSAPPSIGATITNNGPGSSGLAVVTLAGVLPADATPMPLLDYVFVLKATQLGSYEVTLANGTVAGQQNQVILASGGSQPADFVGTGVTQVQVGTSVPSVAELTCTPRTVEGLEGAVSHFIDVSWEIPAGTVYDSGSGSIIVSLNGNQVAGLQGSATSATVPGVLPGLNTVTVVAHQGGLASAPAECVVYLVPAPSAFTCVRQPSGAVELAWHNNAAYSSLRLYRDGTEILSLGGSFTAWSDSTASAQGGHLYQLEALQIVTSTSGPVPQLSPRVACQVADLSPSVTPPAVVTLTIQGLNDVLLAWTNAESYEAIEVRRNSQLITSPALPGTATSYLDAELPPGDYFYLVRFISGPQSAELATTPASTADFGGGIQLPAPSGLSCLPQIGAGVANSPEVHLLWTNPVAYDEILVTRLLGGAPDGSVFVAGTDSSYVDASVPEGAYQYRVEGRVAGLASASNPTCSVTLENRLAVASVATTVAIDNERLVVTGQLLSPASGFSFSLRWDQQAAELPSPPVVLLADGTALAASAIVVVTQPQSTFVTLQVSALTAALPAGAEVPVATVLVNIPASFTAVGGHPITIVDAAFGAQEISNLVHGTLNVAGDALLIDPQVAVPGQSLDLAAYGTFDQAIGGVTVLLAFDPEIVTLMEVSAEGTAIPSGLLFGNFSNTIGYSSAAVIGLPSGTTLPSAPPSIHVPLIYYSFLVNPDAPPGADTGIRLADPDEIPTTQQPPLPHAIFSTTTGSSVTPLFINSLVLVEESLTPFISSVQPVVGTIYGGEQVTIQGTQLSGTGLQVTIGGQAVPVVNASAQQLLVVAPAISPAPTQDTALTVTVSHELGSDSAAGAFEVRVPRLYELVPAVPGVAGQARIIAGEYFPATTAGTSVRFGSTPATVLGINPARTELTVVVPAGTGQVEVAVTFPGQPERLVPGGFSYIGAPGIQAVFPAIGPMVGGGVVTITATQLSAGQVTVQMGGLNAAVLQVTAAQVTVTAPAYPGFSTIDVPVDVVLSTAAGSSTLPGGYVYRALDLSSLSPTQGGPEGGTPVTILGAGLAASGTLVEFGGVPAVVQSAAADGTTLAVVTPAGLGTVDVTVTLADGQAKTLPAAFAYVAQSFFVTGMSPQAGSACGGETVTISGGGFQPGVMQVTFGGVSATSVGVSPDTLTVVTPAGSGEAAVVVSNSVTTQQETLADAFTFGFIRGDFNHDQAVNLVDLSLLSSYVLAGGAAPQFQDAADVNDDGLIHVGDVTFLGSFLSQTAGVTIPAPTGTPGADPTPDGIEPCN